MVGQGFRLVDYMCKAWLHLSVSVMSPSVCLTVCSFVCCSPMRDGKNALGLTDALLNSGGR